VTTRTVTFDFSSSPTQLTWTVDQDYFIVGVYWNTNTINTRVLLTTDKAKLVANLATQTVRFDCIIVLNNQASGTFSFGLMRHPITKGELLCASTGAGTNNQLCVVLEYATDASIVT
jgi:hypothetical protein